MNMLGNKTNGKSLYVTPEMDITVFSGEDVIATSGWEGAPSGWTGTEEQWDALGTGGQNGWLKEHGIKQNVNQCG